MTTFPACLPGAYPYPTPPLSPTLLLIALASKEIKEISSPHNGASPQTATLSLPTAALSATLGCHIADTRNLKISKSRKKRSNVAVSKWLCCGDVLAHHSSGSHLRQSQ